ncbi:MAG: MerR family transcriptional regulator [Dokdonella sp.]|nr:MerR family transcriptional regulator [Dokdonella sp.]
MKIGEFALRASVGIDTVRYCERQGQPSPSQRQTSGYRNYRGEEVARLRFVRRAKALDFKIVEIRELLLSDHRGSDMADVEGRFTELQRMRNGLKTLAASCQGQGALEQCPILDALSKDAA